MEQPERGGSASKRQRETGGASETTEVPINDAFYTSVLELLAFALHPGDTQSTTTLAVSFKSTAIYLTNQGNASFGGIDAKAIKDKLDVIGAALTGKSVAGKGDRPWLAKLHKRDDPAADFLDYHCACADGNEVDKDRLGKVKATLDNIYFPMFKRCEQSYNRAVLTKIKETIVKVVVIQNPELFPCSSGWSTTGLHGESRIIRWLFINKFARKSQKKSMLDDPGEDAISGVIAEFKDKLKSWSLVMGSSQGTCSQCKGCTNAYAIATGEQGNETRSDWMHPLHHLVFRDGCYVVNEVALAHHAMRVFFVDDWDGWDRLKKALVALLTPPKKTKK
jgi:hypothetical protein